MSTMLREISFDVTHIVSRLPITHPSGIDKVDLAYGHHFAQAPISAAVHYGLRRPRFYSSSCIRPLMTVAAGSRWDIEQQDDDPGLTRLKAFLTGNRLKPDAPAARREHRANGRVERRLLQIRWRLARGESEMPANAIYVNAAQHAFEHDRFFKWLEDRPDVLPTFLVHDLLPLDYPEYFPPGYQRLFQRRFATIFRYSKALITTTEHVAERLRREFRQHGRDPGPIHVEPLPSSLPTSGISTDPSLAAVPYFVVLGTIEPRKNHLHLLNIWRRFAEAMQRPPKFVIIGSRGWENEQVLDVLDRCDAIRPHVFECSGLSDHAVAKVIKNARALLMPSFAEGYGLPVVEALSLGTPVIASDISVFQEVGRGCAILHHPLDGPRWMKTILDLSANDHDIGTARHATRTTFQPPTWDRYFRGVDEFLAGL